MHEDSGLKRYSKVHFFLHNLVVFVLSPPTLTSWPPSPVNQLLKEHRVKTRNQTRLHQNQTFTRKREGISLTDTIRGVKDMKGGRVNLYSVLNCLISLRACKTGKKGREEMGRAYKYRQI